MAGADWGRIGSAQSLGLDQCSAKDYGGNNDVQGESCFTTPSFMLQHYYSFLDLIKTIIENTFLAMLNENAV